MLILIKKYTFMCSILYLNKQPAQSHYFPMGKYSYSYLLAYFSYQIRLPLTRSGNTEKLFPDDYLPESKLSPLTVLLIRSSLSFRKHLMMK